MSEHDLYELMRREADRAPIGDGNDLARGRSRLRRRRTMTAGTGLVGVAVAAFIGSGLLPESGSDSPHREPVVASHHDSQQPGQQDAERTSRAITDAFNTHTRFAEFGRSGGRDYAAEPDESPDGWKLTWFSLGLQWREAGGAASIMVSVADVEDRVPPWQRSCARSDTDATPGGWPMQFGICERRVVDGLPVLVGVERRADALWIRVKYLRTDQQLVELSFSSPIHTSDLDPILDPSLTTAELVAIVTDPGLRLHND
ncbi:MAG: hypothetical protein ACRDQ2_02770 [Gaiellales bacterium]